MDLEQAQALTRRIVCALMLLGPYILQTKTTTESGKYLKTMRSLLSLVTHQVMRMALRVRRYFIVLLGLLFLEEQSL